MRVPLTAATRAGLDLRRIASLELTPRTALRAGVADGRLGAGAPAPPPCRTAALPRIDIGRLKVKEGDSGVRTYRVPVRVSGKGSGTVRLYVLDPATGKAKDRLVTVRPGAAAST